MTTTVYQIINQPLTLAPINFTADSSIHLTTDCQTYPRITTHTESITPPLRDQNLGPLRLSLTPFILGGFQAYRPNQIGTEQDVIDYATNELLNPLRAAFSALGESFQTRAEIPAPGSPVVRVDRLFYCGALADDELYTILEFKRPGYIRREDWEDWDHASTFSKKHSQKLRMCVREI